MRPANDWAGRLALPNDASARPFETHPKLAPYGRRPTAEIFSKLGGPPERFLATLLDDARHVPAAVERMESYHRDHGHRIRAFTVNAALLQSQPASFTDNFFGYPGATPSISVCARSRVTPGFKRATLIR